jgi:hypothetical protein
LQFYAIDKSNGPDSRPLLEIMADHSERKFIKLGIQGLITHFLDSVFYSALALFPNVTIYANR